MLFWFPPLPPVKFIGVDLNSATGFCAYLLLKAHPPFAGAVVDVVTVLVPVEPPPILRPFWKLLT